MIKVLLYIKTTGGLKFYLAARESNGDTLVTASNSSKNIVLPDNDCWGALFTKSRGTWRFSCEHVWKYEQVDPLSTDEIDLINCQQIYVSVKY